MTGDIDWMADAVCADLPLVETEALFFGEVWAARQEGIALCQACPVRIDCLDYASRNEATAQWAGMTGTWGGLTVSQRVKLQKERRRG